MTYEEFLAKLRETPREWELLGPMGWIRIYSGNTWSACPLSAAIGAIFCKPIESSVVRGMNRDLAQTIVDAADKIKHHDPQIRADLLAACGLTEKESV